MNKRPPRDHISCTPLNCRYLRRMFNSHDAAGIMANKMLAALPQIENPLIREDIEKAIYNFISRGGK